MPDKSKPSAALGSQAKNKGNSQPAAKVTKSANETAQVLPARKPQMALDYVIPKAKLMHVMASRDRSKLKKKNN